MSGQDSESSDLDGKVAGSEESPGGDSGNTDGRSGIPGWLGWVVIVAVLLMMAAALVLGAQRFQNGMAAPTPTATSSPAIGSMAVEPQLDTAPVDEANAVTDVESGEPAADSLESTENGGRGADAAGAVDTTETVSVTVEQAPLASALGGQELLIDISSLAVVVVPSASRPEGVPLIPHATELPEVGDQPDNVSSVAAFGRMRGTARATEPTQESTGATPAPTQTATTAPTATPTVLPTTTSTATASPTPTDAPTATLTATVTTVPTATPEPTQTATATPSPTAATSEENAPVGFEPGENVVSQVSDLPLRMESSASSSIMEAYRVGAEFEVLEPANAAAPYPVMAEGVGWIRVRAEDGLVGWVVVDDVQAAD